jgi:geranylgeranyl pyrophosphate synthase
MESGAGDGTASAELRELLRESGALDRARRRAEDYAAAAAGQLACLPDGPARRGLAALPSLLVFRDR